uniref:Uncharacterized protein n=1 Tax=Rheinheimera sp. BAL341 TaxID=1708203 RepID=A0A486XW36_9GAMM
MNQQNTLKLAGICKIKLSSFFIAITLVGSGSVATLWANVTPGQQSAVNNKKLRRLIVISKTRIKHITDYTT